MTTSGTSISEKSSRMQSSLPQLLQTSKWGCSKIKSWWPGRSPARSRAASTALKSLQLLVSPQDTLQVAAVVTDVYGRQGVYSDIPCVLEDGELTWPATPDLSDHDPAHWQYGR